MATQMARQDVMSNNLANVATSGFKPDSIYVRQRQAVRQEDSLLSMPSDALLERLGGGVQPTRTYVGTAPAALERTGSPLDLGIGGNGYFVVRAGSGEQGLRLTRDGRFAISEEGKLVTASDGYEVMGAGDRTIDVDASVPLTIQSDGTIVQRGSAIGRLQLTMVADPRTLAKAGANLLRAPRGQSLNRMPADGIIRQGHLERSGVNAIRTLMGVEGASRSAQGHARIISYYDEMMGRAIGQFGRVA